MKHSTRTAVVLLALVALSAAAKDEVVEYLGQALTPDQGLVILRVEWRRETSGGMSKVTMRDDDKLFIVLKLVEGKGRAVIAQPMSIKAFVLPAGRWYVDEMYTPGNRKLPKIAKTYQSFEVVADKINYAGAYSIEIETDDEGRQIAKTAVDYGPDLVREATEAFPQAFETHELLYCPVGRKCKKPSEFKF